MRGSRDALVALDGNVVTELSVAARAIGVPDDELTAELSAGQTIAEVAARHGVDTHRVVVALVTDAVADVAADVRRGELTAWHVRWLVALARARAEDLVTSPFPPIGFRPGTAAAIPGRARAL